MGPQEGLGPDGVCVKADGVSSQQDTEYSQGEITKVKMGEPQG